MGLVEIATIGEIPLWLMALIWFEVGITNRIHRVLYAHYLKQAVPPTTCSIIVYVVSLWLYSKLDIRKLVISKLLDPIGFLRSIQHSM